jgi:hypothetical protein
MLTIFAATWLNPTENFPLNTHCKKMAIKEKTSAPIKCVLIRFRKKIGRIAQNKEVLTTYGIMLDPKGTPLNESYINAARRLRVRDAGRFTVNEA